MMVAISKLAKSFSSSSVQYSAGMAVLVVSVCGVYYSFNSFFTESTGRCAKKDERSRNIWEESDLDLLEIDESMEPVEVRSSPTAQKERKKQINNITLHRLAKRVLSPRMEKIIVPLLLYLVQNGSTSSSPRVRSFTKGLTTVLSVCSLLYPGDPITEDAQEKPSSNQGDAPLHKDNIYIAAAKFGPAVVHISLPNDEEVASGIIFDEDGLIMTCAHGVANRLHRKVSVSLLDQQTFEGIVISVRKKSGIAFVKVNPYFPLPTVKFPASCPLHSGDWVVAVGSPEPFQSNFTTHRVSEGTKYLQMVGSINVGNSGGLLLDMNGEIVGMNILEVSNGRRLSSVLPVKRINNGKNQFLNEWRTQRNWFGFKIANLSEVIISQIKGRHLEFPDVNEGVIIAEVRQGSPAHAGLQPGDVVLQFDGKEIKRAGQIIDKMKRNAETVEVVVKRGAGAPINLSLAPPKKNC